MKSFLNFSTIIATLVAVVVLNSCDRRFNGQIDISGYLYGTCGTNIPVSGATVNWGMAGAEYITTTTDENGYYRLKGSYNFKTRKPSHKTITVNANQAAFGSYRLAEGMPDNCFLDTAYLRNGTFFQVKINATGISTELDTIYVVDVPIPGGNYFDIYERSGYYYRSKVAGPFQDNQLVGPFELRLDFHHVGYVYQPYDLMFHIHYFRGTEEEPRVSIQDTTVFVFGQPNTPCGQLHTFEVTID